MQNALGKERHSIDRARLHRLRIYRALPDLASPTMSVNAKRRARSVLDRVAIGPLSRPCLDPLIEGRHSGNANHEAATKIPKGPLAKMRRSNQGRDELEKRNAICGPSPCLEPSDLPFSFT
jgi:hypothetical protein